MFNLLLGVGLSTVFEMLRALQIIILLPLLKTNIPANAGMVFNTMTKVAAFDVFEIGEYVNNALELLATDPVNEKFETIGLESLYFINNVGSFFLVVLIDIFLVILILIIRWLVRVKPLPIFVKVHEYLSTNMFWNSWIITVHALIRGGLHMGQL